MSKDLRNRIEGLSQHGVGNQHLIRALRDLNDELDRLQSRYDARDPGISNFERRLRTVELQLAQIIEYLQRPLPPTRPRRR